MRTAAGVVVGYLFFAGASVTLFAVSGQQPHDAVTLEFAIVATVYGIVAAFIGGLVADAIARRPDLRASQVVAAVIAMGAIASMFSVPAGGKRWSMIAALVAMAPAALIGGVFYRKMRSTLVHPPAESV